MFSVNNVEMQARFLTIEITAYTLKGEKKEEEKTTVRWWGAFRVLSARKSGQLYLSSAILCPSYFHVCR